MKKDLSESTYINSSEEYEDVIYTGNSKVISSFQV